MILLYIVDASNERKKEALALTIEETAALVRQMQVGNTAAFDEIFAAYEQKAVRTAALICGELSLAEDITQEAFVTCLLQIEKLQNPYCFSSWFYKILIRCAWKQTKKKQKLISAEELLEVGAQGLPPVFDCYPCEQRGMYEKLYAAIDSLGQKQRTTLILYYFNDFSIKEIARITSSLEATVKSRLFAAKRSLRKALAEKDGQRKGELIYEKR